MPRCSGSRQPSPYSPPLGGEEQDGWSRCLFLGGEEQEDRGVDKKPSLGGKKEARKEMVDVSQNIWAWGGFNLKVRGQAEGQRSS